jgi:uncharacterized protein YfiM (DUF2279 family)
MKRLVALLLALSSYAHADSWTSEDKAYHLVGGAVIGAAVTLQTESKMYGFMAGTAVGLLKEISDRRTTGFSSKDLIVTSIGAALGAQAGGWMITARRDRVAVAYVAEF